jgi:uncharacterized membrane protein (UPF0136 family)
MVNAYGPGGDALDRLGVAASCSCALHCALTPLVVGVLPLAGLSLFADERVEWALLGLSVGLGAVSLLPGYFSRHRRVRAVALFAAGLCLIVAARVLLEEGSRLEIPSVVVGALLIAAAHLVNRRMCRACPAC